MFKKIIVRSIQIFVVLFLIFAATIGACIWLIFQHPAGYADVRDQEFTDEDRVAVEQRLNETTTSIESWFRENIMAAGKVDSNRRMRSFILSQDDLNAILSDDRFSKDEVEKVRSIILDDRIRVAAEVRLSEANSVVVSGDFRLTKTDGSKLKLEILGGSIGRLPFPIASLLSKLPAESLPKDDDIEFRFFDSPPHLLVDISESCHSPVLKRIVTFDKKIKLDFGPPVVAF